MVNICGVIRIKFE